MRNAPSRGLRILFAVAIGIQLVSTAPAKSETFVYRKMCDASAAVAIDADRFVVADDERNTLRIYRRDLADPLDWPIYLSAFLETDGRESDLEGAAAIGNRIYWVSSHGRNKDGEVQEQRWRFFTTEVTPKANPPVKAVGTPYKHLLEDLLAAPQLKDYRLEEAAKLAPEAKGGLSIEGLAVTPAGALLIGFRNPIRHGKALIVPLNNPAGVVEGARAELGDPIELDLEGRGIRSIELVGTRYLVIAGPSRSSAPCREPASMFFINGGGLPISNQAMSTALRIPSRTRGTQAELNPPTLLA